jgi:hypothetical protein
VEAVDWLHGEAEPLDGLVRVSARSWADSVLSDRSLLEPSLRDAGLGETDVQQALELRDEVASQARYWNGQIADFRARTEHLRFFATPPELQEMITQRESVLNRLRAWFAGREFIVEAREERRLPIPVFVVAAADVAGCTAAVSMRREHDADLEWGVTIAGTGLGGGASLTLSSSATFGAASGQVKAVFVTVVVPVERVTVLEDGRQIGEGCRIDAAALRVSGEFEIAVKHLQDEAVPAAGRLAKWYPLAGDVPGAITTYDYTYTVSRSRTVSLGVQAFGADLHVSAAISPSRSVTVTYELVGGSDYELHELAEGCGLVWVRPTAD